MKYIEISFNKLCQYTYDFIYLIHIIRKSGCRLQKQRRITGCYHNTYPIARDPPKFKNLLFRTVTEFVERKYEYLSWIRFISCRDWKEDVQKIRCC